MDWDRFFLEALRGSRPAYDEKPDWRAALALYTGLTAQEAAALDAAVLAMIHEDYRNPYSSHEAQPFDDLLTALPAGMSPDDLLCIEAAVMVAAERRVGSALFAFNRLMRAPRWHAMYPRLEWLSHEAQAAQRMLADTRAGRSLGAMLGLALGDALGATVEFMSRAEIRRKFPEGHREILGGGPFGFAPGEWTDDTAMALAVANGVAEAPDDPVETVGRHFMAWSDSGPPDVGNTVRLALNHYKRTGSWPQVSGAVARELGERAGGNGALMRTLPTAIAYGSDLTHALAIARMTHPHPESDAAVAVYNLTVDALLGGASKEEALAVGLSAAGPLTDRLSDLAGKRETAIRSSGYVVDSLQAALWAFLTTDSLEDCLVRAVNLGDDADTVGAIAGGLAGALWGPLAAPRRWTVALKGRDRLDTAAEQMNHIALRRQQKGGNQA